MKPRYSTILGGMNLLLSGSVKKPSFWNKFIVSITVRRHSAKLWSIAIMLSVYIATLYPYILSIANGYFVNFVNFRRTDDKLIGKAINFKSHFAKKTWCFLTSVWCFLLNSVLISSFKTGFRRLLCSADI